MRIRVYGTPVPKGSMRAFIVKGHPVLTSSAKGLGEWSQKISAAAVQAAIAQSLPIYEGAIHEGAVAVDLTFLLPKPKSAKKDIPLPIKRPDIDKLARAVLDALTSIIWKDDSQVTTLTVRKRFADLSEMTPGVVITVEVE